MDREEDATNNCSRHLTLEVRDDPPDPPDLAVTNLTVSTAELDPRESFVLSAEVVNLGGSTTPPTRLRYRRRSAGRSWTDVGSYSACVSEVAGEIDTGNNCSVSVRVDVRVPCVVEPLGSAQRERRVATSWAGACISPRRAPPGTHARYYSFSVQGGRSVRIGLSSPVHGSLHLRRGQAVDGSLVTSASGADPRIVRTLSSGTYTVEVLPLQAGVTAAFVLRVGVRQPFVDDPLQVGDPIKAVHVTELRERIDILRGTAGLTRFRWTDPSPRDALICLRLDSADASIDEQSSPTCALASTRITSPEGARPSASHCGPRRGQKDAKGRVGSSILRRSKKS